MHAAARYARQTWEFVNLYSTTRGCNRFPAVVRTLDLLRARPEIKARGVAVPQMAGLRAWIERESKLGNPALEAEVSRTRDDDLRLTLAWSLDVNDAVKKIVRNVPPFPRVRESLEKLISFADTLVVSQTPTEALEREWREHDLARYVRVIAGQELGTKSEHLAMAAKGKYAPGNVLMIGDAPGDYRAARDNDALFFPITPGKEEDSWELFFGEALGRFFGGTYAGKYEEELIARFNACLPQDPAW
jgi:phosphoglycolate phosphatase-like HAD superfamily hydrolase